MTTVKDIARILADKYSLQNVEAEIFMQMIVEVINDGLLQDRQVKIKGFGTFKIQTVKERSSVNVNTGEKVVIAEHDKITFTPDTVMKDLINKPFAQFETVVVNDNSPLLNANNEYEETSTPSYEENFLTTQEDVNKNENIIEEVLPVENNESKTEETKNATRDNITEEDSIEADEIKKEQGEEIKESDIEIDLEKVKEEEGHNNSDEKNATQVKDDEQEENCEQQYPQCRNIFIYYGILINVIVATIAFTLGYMSSSNGWFTAEEDVVVTQQNSKSVKKITNPSKKVLRPNKPAMVKGTVKHSNTISEQQKEPQNLEKIKEVTVKAEEVAKKEERQETPPLHAYDNDIRVKTGAYYIMGTEKIITVKPGQTLTSISRTYLGDGMECYIEAYNSKNEVRQGDKIKIPKLKLKKLVNKKR